MYSVLKWIKKGKNILTCIIFMHLIDAYVYIYAIDMSWCDMQVAYSKMWILDETFFKTSKYINSFVVARN